MKAITLHQPWATAIARGYKRFETRSWGTQYRGPIAIHAGKQTDFDELDYLRELPHIPDMGVVENGCIVAVAYLFMVYLTIPGGELMVDADQQATTYLLPKDGTLEVALGNYTPNRYVWQLNNVTPLAAPIYCRGYQGLWDVPDRFTAEMRKQLDIAKPVEYVGSLSDA